MMLELSLLSELVAAWATFQAAAVGLSVGAAAATGVAAVVCTAATIHNIYVGAKIVNAVVDAVEAEESGAAGKGNTGRVTQGKPRAPKTGTPGSVYEQVDNEGNVMSRTTYGNNGQPEHRDDYKGKPHYDKKTGKYLRQHRHSFKYNDKGQPIGETVSPIIP